MVSRECSVYGQNTFAPRGSLGSSGQAYHIRARKRSRFGQYCQQFRLDVSRIPILFSFNIYVEIEKYIGEYSAESGCNLPGKMYSDRLKRDAG